VASVPADALIERFGQNLGPELRRRARFEHAGEVQAVRKVVSESRERTFDHDLDDPARLREELERMAQELCASLAAHRRRGRTIGIKVRLDDFTTVTRARTLLEPTWDVEMVRAVALGLLENYSPPRPVRLLGVRVAGLVSADAPGDDARRHSGPGTAAPSGADQLALPV
jgi:DNA polymerase IV